MITYNNLCQKLIFSFLFFVILNAKAQPWLEHPYLNKSRSTNKIKSLTFFDIQKAFYKYERKFDRKHKEEVEELAKEGEDEGKFSGYTLYKRWEYYMAPRVGVNGDLLLPAKMRYEYFDSLSKQNSLKTNNNITPQNISGNWIPLGPFNSNLDGNVGGLGRLSAIRFDPTNNNKIWACSPAGGLWKSIDGGLNWTISNTDFNAQIGCTDVAINPAHPDTMYIATGDADANVSALSVSSQGVLKSTNGGLTWNPTGLTFTNNLNIVIYKLLINPNNPNIVIAATSHGIYRTTNGGTTWPQVLNTSSYKYQDIDFNPLNPNVIYGTSQFSSNGYLHKSTDGGLTWPILNSTGLPATSIVRRSCIAITPQDTNKVYYLTSNSANKFNGFYVSDNSGATFTLRSTTPDILSYGAGVNAISQAHYAITLTVCPTDTAKIIVGGGELYKSIDGGINWSVIGHFQTAPYIHADHHDVQFVPGNSSAYLCANDGGLSKTINDGVSWTTMDNGFQTSQIYGLGTSKINPNYTIIGLQDNACHLLDGNNWSFYSNSGGDCMDIIFDNHTDEINYHTAWNGRVYKTFNHGQNNGSWVVNTGTGAQGVGSWKTPFIQHPTLDSTFLIGKSQVYRTNNATTDVLTTWNQVGSISGGTGLLIALAYAPSNPNWIYAAKYDRFYTSINGSTFTDRTAGLPVSANNMITSITVSNTDSSKVWLSMSGYIAANKVWYSPDAGVTWINYSTGLANFPVNTILYQKNSMNALYVGTDIGVYYRNDTLASWQPFKTNLPNVDVQQLEIIYSLNKIRAATNGRGLWESDLYNSSVLLTLNLKVFLQGFYQGSGIMNTALKNSGIGNSITNTDSITVELHDKITKTFVVSTSTILHTDGSVNCTFNAPLNSYYIVIKHRNSLETWSKNPILLSTNLTSLDFTSSTQ